jgi:hypothetical protein
MQQLIAKTLDSEEERLHEMDPDENPPTCVELDYEQSGRSQRFYYKIHMWYGIYKHALAAPPSLVKECT